MGRKVEEFIDLGSVEGSEGQWVAVYKEKVVASSDDYQKLLEITEQYPEDELHLTKILYPGASFY
jgi:hypothetical protein